MTDALEERLRAELSPDLEVLRPLGHGSAGSVYLAREPALKRLVAVKVLRPNVASDETARRRFEREAQAAARLNHPNLTDVYRVGRLQAGVPYIVMEYIDGRNLADALKARGLMAVDEVRAVIAGVADALAAAHAKGIIHRDVRPANVLREEHTSRIVLTDFGIAAFLDSGSETTTQLTTVGHRIGDPRYMSPEHLDGEPLTEQSDVYSLGVLGYVLLTGEGPYPGGTRAEALIAHLHEKPRRLRELRPDVAPSLAVVLERCLERNPNHRPRAAEIAPTLARGALDGGRGDGVLGMFMGEMKRRRVWKVGAAYTVFTLASLGLLEPIRNNFPLTQSAERAFVILVLTGFPLALALAWAFDIHEGRVRRSASDPHYDRSIARRVLPWLGLGLSMIFVILLGWVLLARVG